ncbi:hypothetical protein PSHT_10590 [Puccinia striiformis]|uniref:SWIM-type domain-containing protein n=1 Tax=Puccinia striiformis TaxID=27350 RepID=A0A2S4V8P9_9BASI|nr:hypothetical protein PSHT_10590 [Puccinia striiformis]
MLQSLSDSLKVKAQAILDNFDPEKLTKINSFFNNCLGKISNFALQKAQHNFTQTRESSPPTTCTNSHTTRTGIPCKHRILELLELGLLAQPEHFDPQWHLRHQGGLVGGLNSTEGGVETPGTERRHPNFVAEGDWERRHPKKTPGTERRQTKHDGERRHPKQTPGTERRHPKHDGERRHPKQTPGTNVGTLNTMGNVGTLKKPLEPNVGTPISSQRGIGNVGTLKKTLETNVGRLNTMGNVGTLNKPLEPNVGTLNTMGNVGTLKKPLEPNVGTPISSQRGLERRHPKKTLEPNVGRLIPLNSHSPSNQRTSSSSPSHP